MSHGLNKLVTHLKTDEQETSEMRFEEYALRLCKDNTSKDPFSHCDNLQNLHGIHAQVKKSMYGNIDDD